MALEILAIEMRTGRRLITMPATKGDWSIATNDDDSVTCTVKGNSVDAKRLGVWGFTQLARNGLVAVVDGVPVAGGPIWKRRYKQGGDMKFTAGGLWSYWSRRILLPYPARVQSIVDGFGVPNASLDTNLSGLSYGTIAKRWVQLALAWPGGSIPMQLPEDELGSRIRNVAGVDLKRLGDLLDDLTQIERGPDIMFRPRWAADGLGVYWQMVTGTEANPRIGNTDPDQLQWNVGGKTGAVSSFEIEEDGTAMAEEIWATGGRSSDHVIVGHGRDSTLYDAGFPLLQDIDTSHSTVKEQATIDGYAQQGAILGKYASSFWKMSVRAHERGALGLGDYWLGDLATINVAGAEPVIDEGSYTRRIASISGNLANENFQIQFAEAITQ